MSAPTITQHLEEAQSNLAKIDERIARLQHDRDVEVARVEAFKLAMGAEPMIEQPVRHTIRANAAKPAPAKAPSTRAPAGSWKLVFRTMLKDGRPQFNYDDVVSTAAKLGITAEKTSARVRVSKFKDGGYLERVDEGVYKVTPEGEKFFAES